jgi:LCP family protein required for cell wall assembly
VVLEAVSKENAAKNASGKKVKEKTNEKKQSKKTKSKLFKNKTEKKIGIAIFILIGVLLLAIIACVTAYFLIHNVADKVDYDGENSVSYNKDYSYTIDPTETGSLGEGEYMEGGGGKYVGLGDLSAADLKDYYASIKTFYNKNLTMSSPKVTNVLLLGRDDAGDLTDSMIVVSVNAESKQVKMISILRDSLAYNAYEKAGAYKEFMKMNTFCKMGGEQYIVLAIEKHYKIKIDSYVSVSLSSYRKIVDILGGIDMQLSAAEANYLQRMVPGFQNKGAGAYHLNAKAAEEFARARKLDSDMNRSGRQRRLLEEIKKQMSGAGYTKLYGIVNAVAPLTKTSFTKDELLGLVGKFEEYSKYSMPKENSIYLPDANITPWCIHNVAGWSFLPDYWQSAQTIQLFIYGKTTVSCDPADGYKPVLELITKRPSQTTTTAPTQSETQSTNVSSPPESTTAASTTTTVTTTTTTTTTSSGDTQTSTQTTLPSETTP